MLLYQGQTVWLEWQSLQARFKLDATCGGGFTIASKDAPGSEVGLVRVGRNSCITITAKNTMPPAILNRLDMFVT